VRACGTTPSSQWVIVDGGIKARKMGERAQGRMNGFCLKIVDIFGTEGLCFEILMASKGTAPRLGSGITDLIKEIAPEQLNFSSWAGSTSNVCVGTSGCKEAGINEERPVPSAGEGPDAANSEGKDAHIV